jgi:uncharacterized protein YggE
VQTVAPSLGAATQENAARMTAIVAALRKAGATDRELRTTGLSIYPQQGSEPGKQPRILGYQVSNNVAVTRDDVATIGRLLEAAVQAARTRSAASTSACRTRRGKGHRPAGRVRGCEGQGGRARPGRRPFDRTARSPITEGGAAMPPVPMPMYRRAEMAQAASIAEPVEAGAEEIAFTCPWYSSFSRAGSAERTGTGTETGTG